MNLIEKKLGNYKLTIPKQALPTVNEIWNDKIYTKIYKIKKDDIIFDIGANAGIFSIFAASAGAEVYSFEPNPDMFHLLNKNIKDNNLMDKIHPFNTALGDINGDVILSIPISDKIYSEACASINDSFIHELEKTAEKGFKKLKIKCSKLSSIINNLNIKKISLVKMDCEGAEYSIMESLDKNSAAIIHTLSMEMHGTCYTQKQLCALVNDKNFIIDEITKISLIKNTGFIYCSKKGMSNKKITNKPIAVFNIITTEPCVYINSEITVDGTDSFITNNEHFHLEYTWYLNNNLLEYSSKSINNIKIEKPGLNTVKLEVSINNTIDIMEKHFFAVQPGYFKNKIDFKFEKQNYPLESTISEKEKTFMIPSGILPHYKKTGNIILGIEKLKSTIPIVLTFNGREFYIKDNYEQLELDDIYFEEDIIFTLKTGPDNINSTNVKIKWWEAPEKPLNNEFIKIQKGNTNTKLPAQGFEMMFQFTGEKLFSISHKHYPVEWVPDKMIIGIDAVDYNNTKTPLTGYINFKTQKYILDGYYKEIELNNLDLEVDLDFKIELITKNCIKITWWNE